VAILAARSYPVLNQWVHLTDWVSDKPGNGLRGGFPIDDETLVPISRSAAELQNFVNTVRPMKTEDRRNNVACAQFKPHVNGSGSKGLLRGYLYL
jgi:hypothetical protein